MAGHRYQPLRERLLDNYVPEPNTGCWLWTASITHDGYGRIRGGTTHVAHRASYETFIGPIAEGLQLDHKCRVRSCINPDHLEPVTGAVNVHRGIGFGAVNAFKTHCPKGHPLVTAPSNIRVRRFCKICSNELARLYQVKVRARRKQALLAGTN